MWANVSRTDVKLDPMGWANCSGVSFSAAPIVRWFAHELYSKRSWISCGDMGIVSLAERLERAFLCECKSGQGRAGRALRDFHAHCRRIRRRNFGWTQHRILGKDFVIDLGDQKILATFVLAPHLPQLNGFHCHIATSIQSNGEQQGPSIAGRRNLNYTWFLPPFKERKMRGDVHFV